jgi:hypothetical protein|tara:strand:+ start:449 stop:631 length:183 start_codon:yes stop_codon:yes gene_type:complete
MDDVVFRAEIELGKQVMNNLQDPVLRNILMEAHAERWGTFVATWPVTLLVLSYILEKKVK